MADKQKLIRTTDMAGLGWLPDKAPPRPPEITPELSRDAVYDGFRRIIGDEAARIIADGMITADKLASPSSEQKAGNDDTPPHPLPPMGGL